MTVDTFEYYKDFTAESLGDFVDSDFTVYDGVCDIVDVDGTNALSNDPADSTNVVRIGYTADDHTTEASVGVIRAYPDDGSDSTMALTLGSSGAGYNFSSSLGSENCYAARWINTSLVMYRISGGTVTQVFNDGGGSPSATPTEGAEMIFSMEDSGSDRILRILVDDVEYFTYTDTSPLTLSGGVASISFKGQENLNSSFRGFGIEGLVGVAPTAGITTKTLQRGGVNVSATTADVMVFDGTSLTGTPEYAATGVSVSSGVLSEIDLSATSLAVSDDVVVAVLPSTGGPGIVLQTTVEDIS